MPAGSLCCCTAVSAASLSTKGRVVPCGSGLRRPLTLDKSDSPIPFPGYIASMTTQDIKALPAEEKVRIMETIWEDMRDHYEEAPISQDVIDLLKERQARVERGEARLLDWDMVKSALGRE